MKHLLYILSSLLLLAACQQEELPADRSVGYLSIEGLSIEAGDIEVVQTRASSSTAIDPSFIVDIIPSGGGELIHYDAGTVPGKIELAAGDYTLKVFNEAYGKTFANEELGSAAYYLEKEFRIEDAKVNYLTETVPMTNIGVQLTLPDGFNEWFSYTFSVTIGNRTVKLTDGKTAYFDANAGEKLSYALKATNTEGERTNEGDKENLSPGTIYSIKYSFSSETKSLSLSISE